MLYYNFNQCTGGSRQEFYELTIGEVLDIIVTYVNINSKNNKKQNNKNNNNSNVIKGEKETYYRVDN